MATELLILEFTLNYSDSLSLKREATTLRSPLTQFSSTFKQ